ncbi:hypothetical protein [Niabella sp.]|uniref:hypothetical protein n=1 Tax=Niabella sp. TaxID=1962976 RepID=UPI0026388600|nr:hypothetical protein [Niabella sp.]
MKRCLAFLINVIIGTTPLFAQSPAHRDSSANQPLFIVDSTIVENMSNLRPEDIESITVLKGQDAISTAARFGKDAAGGLVLITTKDPRRYLPVVNILLLRQITLTPHTLVMVDNKLIEDPIHYRLDTSKPVQVYIEDINRFGYIDTLYKQLKIVRIVTNPAANIRTTLQGRLRRDAPPEEENKPVIYIRGTDPQKIPVK